MKNWMKRHVVLSGILAVVLVFCVTLAVLCSIDIHHAAEVLRAIPTHSVQTSYGKLTYAESGSGVPMLVVHGIDGGYDQGLESGKTLAKGLRVICPSRFGYPESDMPKDATPEAQADAFRQLLDRLGIQKTFLVGTSAGGPPVLQFALKYPDRTAGIILLSTGFPTEKTTKAQGTGAPTFLMNDFTMWAGIKFFRPMILQMLGMDGSVSSQMSTQENDRVQAVLTSMLPMSIRKAGYINDLSSSYDMNLHYDDYPLEKISVPVLVIHAKNDRLAKWSDVEQARKRLPNATWAVFDHGGHMLFGQDTSGIIESFLQKHPIR